MKTNGANCAHKNVDTSKDAQVNIKEDMDRKRARYEEDDNNILSSNRNDSNENPNNKNSNINRNRAKRIKVVKNGVHGYEHEHNNGHSSIPSLLSRIVKILSDRDEIGILSQEFSSGSGKFTIHSKIEQEMYQDATSFLLDINTLVANHIKSKDSTIETRKHAEVLRIFAHNLLRQTLKLKENTSNQNQLDVNISKENQLNKVHNSIDISEKQSLMFRVGDRFVFTSAERFLGISDLQDINGSGMEPVVIHPIQPDNKNIVPKLSSLSISSREIYSSNSPNSLPKSTAITYIDYNPFQSYSPSIDSSTSLLSYEDSLVLENSIRLSKYVPRICIESAKEEMEAQDKPLPLEELSKEGFDIEAIQAAFDEGGVLSTISSLDLDSDISLETNAELLFELTRMQQIRNVLGECIPSKEEVKVAKFLEKRFMELVNLNLPKDLINSKDISRAMQRIIRKDEVYNGSLPIEQPFSFSTNVMHAAAFPTQAFILPQTEKQIEGLRTGAGLETRN